MSRATRCTQPKQQRLLVLQCQTTVYVVHDLLAVSGILTPAAVDV
jgi:hypothetical protein